MELSRPLALLSLPQHQLLPSALSLINHRAPSGVKTAQPALVAHRALEPESPERILGFSPPKQRADVGCSDHTHTHPMLLCCQPTFMWPALCLAGSGIA